MGRKNGRKSSRSAIVANQVAWGRCDPLWSCRQTTCIRVQMRLGLIYLFCALWVTLGEILVEAVPKVKNRHQLGWNGIEARVLPTGQQKWGSSFLPSFFEKINKIWVPRQIYEEERETTQMTNIRVEIYRSRFYEYSKSGSPQGCSPHPDPRACLAIPDLSWVLGLLDSLCHMSFCAVMLDQHIRTLVEWPFCSAGG